MHEMSLVADVVDLVERRTTGCHVTEVRLRVGALTGVLPDAMRFCFEMVATGTTCEGAALEIDEPPGRAHCRTCGADFDTGEVLPLCACGSADVAVMGGTELRIREVEMA